MTLPDPPARQTPAPDPGLAASGQQPAPAAASDARKPPRPSLHFFRDSPLDGPTNMARDEHLLYAERWRPAALRIYAWNPPTLSLGCFQRFAQIADLPDELRRLPVVRRQTGGGAIVHADEVTYCLVLDETIPLAGRAPTDLYRLVHDAWRAALAEQGVETRLAPEHFPLPTPRGGPFLCFERPGRTDLLLDGVKVLGSAQRRTNGRVLQHGSLLLGAFEHNSGAGVGGLIEVERCIERFAAHCAARLDLTLRPATWSSADREEIERRRERYASAEWTRLR